MPGPIKFPLKTQDLQEEVNEMSNRLTCHWEFNPIKELPLFKEIKEDDIDILNEEAILLYSIFQEKFVNKPYIIVCALVEGTEFTETSILRCTGWDTLEDASQACEEKQDFSDFVEQNFIFSSNSYGFRYFVVKNDYYIREG